MKQSMTLTVEQDYDTEYRLSFSTPSKEVAKKVKDLIDDEILSPKAEPRYTEPQYVSLADMSFDQQQALLTAAKLFYITNGNKINTIKHIRTLTMSCNLLEGKQLVEWAIGGDGMRPSWGKVTAF